MLAVNSQVDIDLTTSITMVRLITHNMLACHVREYPGSPLGYPSPCPPRLTAGNCTKDNFPLSFSEVELVVRPAEENLDFLRRFMPKLDWTALVDTARSLGDTSLPDVMPSEWTDEQLKALHHVLLEVCATRGELRTGNSSHLRPHLL